MAIITILYKTPSVVNYNILTKKKKCYFATAPLIQRCSKGVSYLVIACEEKLCNRNFYKAKSVHSYVLCSLLMGSSLL